MIKNITIPQKLLSIVNKDIFQALTDLFGIKFKNHADIFRILRKNPNYRSQIFDLINMLPALNLINYEIKKKLEKNILKKTLINWTYPQIRFDDILSKKFSAPAHKDRWVIDKDKTGYIVWIPLKKGGANLLVAENDQTKKIKVHNYWDLEAKGSTKFKKTKVEFGKGLLFDADLLHKSSATTDSRITLQLRYEEITRNKIFRRSVNQKIDPKVLKYWKKTLI
jgi:hypothetical protein